MFQQNFGLKYVPLGNNCPTINFEDEGLKTLKDKFLGLLHNPGIGLLTGEPGVGKTAALRHIVKDLNPHEYQTFYLSETLFTSCDIYRQLAMNLGLTPAYRFSQLWRDIKNQIRERYEHKRSLPIFIIDEAHNLPDNFFRGFPSFINYDFDSKNMMSVWFVGHPILASIIDRVAHTALASRIHTRHQIQPLQDRDKFNALITTAFKDAGCHSKLLSDSGMELIRVACQGRLRIAHQLLVCAMKIATQKAMNHLPDDVLQEAIQELKKS